MDFFRRVTTDTTVLTPNRRLSAVIAKKYAEHQHHSGIKCWKTLDILPLYPSWLERFWKRETSKGSIDQLLLSPLQEQILWEKIIRDAPENETLLQLSNTAKLAKSAWEILKRWEVDLEHPSLPLTEDSRGFLKWAHTFQNLCQSQSWLDPHSLSAWLIQKIKSKEIHPPHHIVLVGFTEVAPQYHSLLKVCEQYGSIIEFHTPPSRNKEAYQVGLPTTELEIQTMAEWAKSLLATSTSIACIIPNLEVEREKVNRIFTDILGKNKFNISAGKSLSAYPILHDAFKLLQLNKKNINFDALSYVLHSPFVGEAEKERNKRAFYETVLRSSNIHSFSITQLLSPNLKFNIKNYCPLLAKRLEQFYQALDQCPSKQFISEWVVFFSDLLQILGWPGQRSLNSQEYQVIQNAWFPLLTIFSSYDQFLGPQTYHNALMYLMSLAASTVFQPESPETSIHVLGLLEAAEIPFEYSWVMGLDDTTWPSKPKPNPFIPLRLQKLMNMPNASATRELNYCRKLTSQLQDSAEHIIFSYPSQKEDMELRPSSLLKDYPPLPDHCLNFEYQPIAAKIFNTRALEYFTDDLALPIGDEEKISGGVSIFKNQANCSFKAFAEHRLNARKLEDTLQGLRKLDRGNLVHLALEMIWSELKDSSTLLQMPQDQLALLIKTSVNKAMEKNINQTLLASSRYLDLEQHRLEKMLTEWLKIEKQRPAFKVVALEQEINIQLGNIHTSFRIDRIDEILETGKYLIIDYKTGKNLNKTDWFGERLSEPQLPIYCIAHEEQTIGIAFAEIVPSHPKFTGVSEFPLNIETIEPLNKVNAADSFLWQEQNEHWRKNLIKLADDFYQGIAKVEPKNGALTCRYCGLQPLCRVHEFIEDEDYADALDP